MIAEIIIAIIGSGALSALVSGLFSFIRDRDKKNDGVRAGVRALLFDRINFLGNKYIADGEIKCEDLQRLVEMHTIYHNDLGGNGYLDTIMASVKELPKK
jgi:hypothetical protein